MPDRLRIVKKRISPPFKNFPGQSPAIPDNHFASFLVQSNFRELWELTGNFEGSTLKDRLERQVILSRTPPP
jgi:hypothetical protein